MKKIISLALSVLLAAGLMACASKTGDENASGKLNVVCTIFPQYDWVCQILGDRVGNTEMTMLLDNGVDLHSYQPTADDIVKISECDLFIYVGGESDAWVDDALAQPGNDKRVTLCLMDILGDTVREEEAVEGMQEEEHEHDGEEGQDHGQEEEPEYDEHVWLSLKNAAAICSAISDALCALDAEHADAYHANCAAYLGKLNELDAQYESVVQSASRDTLVFADRFPFRYLLDDYGLNYYAAFAGCSAETEASFETVVFLAGKVDELRLPAVLVLENSDGAIARTVIANTSLPDTAVLVMDSIQSVTTADMENGKTYLASMRENLETLKEALG